MLMHNLLSENHLFDAFLLALLLHRQALERLPVIDGGIIYSSGFHALISLVDESTAGTCPCIGITWKNLTKAHLFHSKI